LESSPDLPLAARTSYRFRPPTSPHRRAAWNEELPEGTARDLRATADLFAQLAATDPSDAAAWYNRALCLAWLGENRESIACLDGVVSLEAAQAFDQAVEAWTLCEVLRQGGGAELLADDLRFACTIAWKPSDTAWLLAEFPEIERVSIAGAPGAKRQPDAPAREFPVSPIEVFEWL